MQNSAKVFVRLKPDVRIEWYLTVKDAAFTAPDHWECPEQWNCAGAVSTGGVSSPLGRPSALLQPEGAGANMRVAVQGSGARAVNLLDAQGRIVARGTNAGGGVWQLDRRTVTAGVYIVRVDGDEEVQTARRCVWQR